MKLFILTIVLSLTSNSCSMDKDCGDLKIGTFTTQSESFGVITVTRTETQSIEDIPAINKKMVNSIYWTSDYTFTLEYESGDKPPTATADLPIDCEIIDVGEDYHIVRCQIRGTETKFDYTMKNKTN